MAVSPVMNNNNGSSPTTNKTTANSMTDNGATGSSVTDISQSFMTLLVAQMKNQDPTNPMDNSQLTSQLAQLNTAAGVEKLNNTLNGMGLVVNSMQQMNASQWVGHNVIVEGDSVVSNAQNGKRDFAFSLGSDADKVTVSLTDKLGNAYTTELKNVKAGVNKYTLSDLTNFSPSDPTANPDGVFKVSFTATNEDGSMPKIVSLKKGKVDSVSFTGGGANLQLGLDGNFPISKIYMVE